MKEWPGGFQNLAASLPNHAESDYFDRAVEGPLLKSINRQKL